MPASASSPRGSGRDALELARSERPEAVILDIGLPDMDGWEVLEHLRSIDGFADIPVVVVSAYAGGGASARAAEQGIDLLEKPFDPFRLVGVVKEALGEPSA